MRNCAGQTPGSGLHLDAAEGGVNVTNGRSSKPLNSGKFGLVADSRCTRLGAAEAMINNIPGFGNGASGGAQTQCVVQ